MNIDKDNFESNNIMSTKIIRFFSDHHALLESLHIIFVVAWISSMLFIARIYVYHVNASKDSEMDKLFSHIERNTLKIIMNPSMIGTIILGLMMLLGTGHYSSTWFHIKFIFVIVLMILHGFFARTRKIFLKNQNNHSAKFYKLINESIFIIFCIIVFIVILKPF